MTTNHSYESHAAVNLGKMLFPLFALALNLPEDFFTDKVQIDFHVLVDAISMLIPNLYRRNIQQHSCDYFITHPRTDPSTI